MRIYRNGIILKDGRVIFLEKLDSDWSCILKSIDLNYEVHVSPTNKKFVRFDFSCVGINEYVFHIDDEHDEVEEIIPTWFTTKIKNDTIKYSEKWFEQRIINNKTIDTLDHGYYLAVNNSNIKNICGTAIVDQLCGNTKVHTISGNARIGIAYNETQIALIKGHSHVGRLFTPTIYEISEQAHINIIESPSTVGSIKGEVTIGTINDNVSVSRISGKVTIGLLTHGTHIHRVADRVHIAVMNGKSCIETVSDNVIIDECKGQSHIENMLDSPKIHKIYEDARIHRDNIIYHNSPNTYERITNYD